jgi:hypothetical protein
MSHCTGPHLPAREGISAAMCSMAPDLAYLLKRAPTLPHAPWLQTPPPCPGGLRRCHMSHRSLWAIDLKNKKMLSWPTYEARLACFQGTHKLEEHIAIQQLFCGCRVLYSRDPNHVNHSVHRALSIARTQAT